METDAPRVRITRVWAENFRSIGAMELELGDVTVLVGRNGAGKSNILSVLRFVRDVVRKGFERTLTDWEGLQNVRRDGSDFLSVGVEVVGGGWAYRYNLSFDGDDARSRSETIRTRTGGEGDWNRFDAFDSRDARASDQSLVYRAGEHASIADSLPEPLGIDEAHREAYVAAGWALLDGISVYNFDPQALKTPQKSRVNGPLAEDGSNLYAVLRSNLWAQGEERLAQALGLAVDDAVGFRVDMAGRYLVGQVLYHGEGDGAPVARDLGVESDGTVHLLAILGALYQSPSYGSAPELVAIEEPGRNLHPGALAVLTDLMKEASERMQILLTTHSPDFVGKFEPEDIRVVERVDGATVVGLLDPIQREIIGDRLFSAADLMRVQRLLRDESS